MRGDGGGGGVEGSRLCTWSPCELWRSNSIFNLWASPFTSWTVVMPAGVGQEFLDLSLGPGEGDPLPLRLLLHVAGHVINS
jgi:hypothetical protein